jgi:hypothetical protein
MAPILMACGVIAVAIGLWRGYANAREAVGPLVHSGEPTRTAVEAARPVHERSRIRRFARALVISVAWIVVALYGLFLVSAATLPA